MNPDPDYSGFECLARDVPGAEGPVFDRNGRLWVVSPDRGQLRVMAEPGVELRVAVEYDGIPAGLAVDRDDHLWIMDMKRGVLRWRADPDRPGDTPRPIVTHFESGVIRGCNDGALDSAGNLYFTAPGGSNRTTPVGQVFCRLAEGGLVLVDQGYHFCNGIAVSADDRRLFVAETYGWRGLWVYDIAEPGVVGPRRRFARLGGPADAAGPDGIDFDDRGHLLSTNYGCDWLEVFDPAGQSVERIRLPFRKASNLHFGGHDGRDLIITEHTNHAVWRTRWRWPGAAMGFGRVMRRERRRGFRRGHPASRTPRA